MVFRRFFSNFAPCEKGKLLLQDLARSGLVLAPDRPPIFFTITSMSGRGLEYHKLCLCFYSWLLIGMFVLFVICYICNKCYMDEHP